jgi:hypothetical protein
VRLLEPYAGRGVVNAGAVAFIGVVDDFLRMGCAALGRDADADRWAGSAAVCYQRMNARWWLRRLDVAPSAPAGAPRTVYLCPVTGDAWRIGPDRATVSIRDVKGLHYIRQLLRRPGVDVSALELSERAAGQPSVVQAGLGELVDRQALAAYRRRLADLDAELDEAEEWSDEGRLARARAEREALVDHLAAAAGLHGRQRLVGGTAERARVAVRKAIAAAIERIEGHDAALARLLRDTIRTGVTCRYDPDPGRPVDWILDPP